MEVQNVPLEPQPDAPSMPSIQVQPIGLSTVQSTTQPQPLPPEPLPVQPQPVQSVSSPAHTPPPPQPLSRPSKKLFLYFGLIVIVLYIVGFGGAWAYSRFFKTKQIPTFEQARSNPVTFSALDPNVYTEEQAIGAIKKAYPDLKDIERYDNPGSPKSHTKSHIRWLRTKSGWKLRFNRGTRPCNEKGDCHISQFYFFTVDLNGTVKKVGQFEIENDSNGDKIKSVGTFLPDFFEEDSLNP